MAGTTTRKASTSKKSESTAKAETSKTKSANVTEDLIKSLMAQIEEQNKKMAEMQEQLNSANSTPTITVDATTDEAKLRGRQFKLINLMHCVLNVSTEPNGKGRVFTFDKYGASHRVRFDDLCSIVSSYPYTVENGFVYIADKDMVEYLGLTESYEKIYDKSTIDKIVLLKTEEDVDMFAGMEKNLQESTAYEIARRINANENVDLNNVNRIKVQCGIDIIKIAEEIKRDTSKKED